MSWLDANDTFLMESAARDRVAELRSTRVDADGSLVEALRRRDSTAAECLIARYGARAHRLAIGITHNAADAEEAVQDAFCSAIRKIDTFRGDAALGSWLYRIVANAACQKVRSSAYRRSEISLDDEYADARAVDDPALRSDLRSALRRALDELAPEYRAVVMLRDVEGRSTADVAKTIGLSIANTKTRLHRGRVLLRKRLATFVTPARAAASHG